MSQITVKPDRFVCSQKIRLKQDPPVIGTGKPVAYFVLLNLTLTVSFSHDSYSESEEELSMLSELS